MKIEITQRDIDLAKKRFDKKLDLCYNCPIALAVKRKTHKFVDVSDTYMEIHKNEYDVYFYRLPVEATNFIRKFDNKEPVKPFTFEVK